MRLPCAKQLPGWKPPFLKTVKIWPLHQKKTLLVFSLQSVKDCFYLTSSLPLPYYLLPPFSSTWNSFLTWVGFERSSNITHCFRATLKWHFRTMDSRPHLFSISSSPSAPKDMPLSEHPHVTSTHFEKIRKKKKGKRVYWLFLAPQRLSWFEMIKGKTLVRNLGKRKSLRSVVAIMREYGWGINKIKIRPITQSTWNCLKFQVYIIDI